jgi:L-rhamnose mutarotase
MQRECFLLRIKKDRIQQYLETHQAVWPELLDAIRTSGLRNWSLFIRPDGLVVGYLEGENIQESLRQLGRTEANARWQAHVASFFEGGSGDLNTGGPEWLKQYFHLP